MTKMDISKILSHTFVFGSLTDDELSRIAAMSSIKRISKNGRLFSEGDSASALYVVANGKLKLYKLSPGGAEQILHIDSNGDLVAEAAIFGGDFYPASCAALEDSILVAISAEGFKKLLMENPQLMLKLLSAYSMRLRHFSGVIAALSLQDIKQRLAAYILANAFKTGGKLVCNLNLSKRELAAMLGTVPETLSRTLNLFKKEKLVAESDNGLTILNRTGFDKYLL